MGCSLLLWRALGGGAAPPALHPQVANTETLGEAPRLVLRLGLGTDNEIDKSPPQIRVLGMFRGRGREAASPQPGHFLGGQGGDPSHIVLQSAVSACRRGEGASESRSGCFAEPRLWTASPSTRKTPKKGFLGRKEAWSCASTWLQLWGSAGFWSRKVQAKPPRRDEMFPPRFQPFPKEN